MTVARTWSVALAGVEGEPVEVEADLSKQTPDFKIIGLPDKALGEAVQRVHNACANSGLSLPRRRLTVNLSPASLPKHGSGFDVAIAIASLATEGTMDAASVASTVHLGELGLDGRLRPIPGILPAVVAAARAGHRRVVVPFANRAEAALVDGMDVLGAVNLAQVAAWHGADVEVPDDEPVSAGDADETTVAEALDLADVIGQREAVEALVTAAAGGHHLLMCGPPGAGKTMLARRLPGILPDLDDRAALTAASIRSLCGSPVKALSRTPPFEAPHHTASVAALVGGGSRVLRPGAIARATEGILFLDEAGEFQATALDALRQPLESGTITIHRATATAQFPARFQLILATNPCPCGDYGIRGGTCTCVPAAIRRYLARLSGPLLDRMDLQVQLEPVVPGELLDGLDTAEPSAAVASRVAAARAVAAERLRGTGWRINADVPGPVLRSRWRLPATVTAAADVRLDRGELSARGYDRVLRVAWSVSDLAGRTRPTATDVEEAVALRSHWTTP